jgi:hypothetical protein
MLNTTFAELKEHGACTKGYKKLAKSLGGIKAYGQDTLIPLTKIIESNGLDDALWCLRATVEDSDKLSRLLACDYAEHVLPIYEAKNPSDKRPRTAIEVSRRFAVGEATSQELDATWGAAWDAAWAAARAAAWDAAWDAASDAARAAAWAAARAAAWAAAGDAAGDAAWAAARAAAWAAAGDAAGDAEQDWQKQQFLARLNDGRDGVK